VALNRKEEARAGIRQILDELDFGRTEPVVRINSIDSGLGEDDLMAVLQAKRLPPTVMIPKVEHPEHIDWIESKISSTLKSLKRKSEHTFNMIIFAESPLAMLRLESICMRAAELSELGAPARLCGIVFGSDDYCANLGVERSKSGQELLYARQKLVLIAKAFQLQAIDMVHIDYKDLEGLKQQSLEGAQMGFTGKQIIHPGQVAVVQEAFSPSPARIEWATELIIAFDEHQKSGKGAFTFRDHMIDMPLVLQARNIVESTKRLNIHQGSPVSAQGSPVAPKGAAAASQGSSIAPQSSSEASQNSPATPQGSPATPQDSPATPKGSPPTQT